MTHLIDYEKSLEKLIKNSQGCLESLKALQLRALNLREPSLSLSTQHLEFTQDMLSSMSDVYEAIKRIQSLSSLSAKASPTSHASTSQTTPSYSVFRSSCIYRDRSFALHGVSSCAVESFMLIPPGHGIIRSRKSMISSISGRVLRSSTFSRMMSRHVGQPVTMISAPVFFPSSARRCAIAFVIDG